MPIFSPTTKETMAQLFGVGKRKSTLLETIKGIGKGILRELLVQPGIEDAPPSKAKERQLKLKDWLKPRTETEERAAKVPRAISEIAQEVGEGILKGATAGYVEPEPIKLETEVGKKVAGAAKTIGEMLGFGVPYGVVTKGFGLGIKATKKIPLMAKVASRIGPTLAGEVAKAAVPFAVYEALAKPEVGETREEAAKRGALIGAIFPLAGAALKPISKPIISALKGGKIRRLEATILQLREEGIPYEEIGKKIGKSAEWVKQAEAKALEKIRPITTKEVAPKATKKTMAEKMLGVPKEVAKTSPRIADKMPPQLIKFKSGLRSFIDAGIPASISSFETLTRSHVQDSVSRAKGVLFSILNNEPRIQKYLADLDDLSAILISAYHKASRNVKTFADLIIKKTGIREISLDIKDVESASKKILRKQLEGKWKSVEEVNDILRGTIIAESKEEARSMAKKFGNLAVKIDDYFLKPKGRYRGINIDLKLPDGSLAELQIHTRQSLDAAAKIHEVYKAAQKKGLGMLMKQSRLPIPRIISPAPEPPKELKITARRMREINRAGISPEEFAQALEAQNRGVIPFPEIIKRSKKLVADIDKIATMRPGTIKTAEQVEAYREAVNGFKNEVKKLEQNYLADPTNSANKAILDNARGKLNRAIINIEAIRSEMARGLSAARIEDEISRAAHNLNKVREQLPPEKQLLFDRAVEKISLEDPASVMRLLTEFQRADFVEKAVEFWKAMLLTAPITHIRNITGNAAFSLFDIPVRALAGGLDAVRSIGGRPRTVYSGEAIRMIYAGLKALPDATIEAMKAMRDEFYQYGSRRMTIEAGHRVPAIKGLKGRIIRLPYRALSAMDLFARTIKTAMETDALAYRIALQEGKRGLELVQRIEELKRNPPAELIDLVGRKVDRAIFLEEIGGILKGIETMKNRYPALQFIIPFYKTPVNLVREAYRMTPLRLIGARKDPWLVNQSTKMEEISRMILGSLISGTIIWKMVDGSIEVTTAAPFDKEERDLFYRQGKLPYAIRIGDTWYSYREIHPFATILFSAGKIGEAIDLYKKTGELKTEEVEKRANEMITDTARYIQDLTFFQGIGNFVEAISGGTYNQGILSIGPNYLGQLMGGFIPNFLYSLNRAADPTIYYTKGFEGQIRARIPGMQEALIPRRNIYGQPLERPGTFWTRFLSPIQVSKEKRDPVDKELEKLKIAIGYPQRKAFSEPLTDFEYDAYLQDSGARIYERLWLLMNSPEYHSYSDYEKEKAIEKVVRESREQSRYALFSQKKQIADYKKNLIAQGYTEAQAEEMAERRFGKKAGKEVTMEEIFTTTRVGTLEELRSLTK